MVTDSYETKYLWYFETVRIRPWPATDWFSGNGLTRYQWRKFKMKEQIKN